MNSSFLSVLVLLFIQNMAMHFASIGSAEYADKLLKEEEIWIRKGVEARRTRAVFRVQRLDILRAERQARRERMGKVNLQLDSGDKSGKLVSELEHVSKAYGQRQIVRDFSARIQRGDKIGVIGPNGAGKTTLLRMILGELQHEVQLLLSQMSEGGELHSSNLH